MTTGIGELKQDLLEEFERLDSGDGFGTRLLHDLVDNVRYGGVSEGSVEGVDEALPRHIPSDELGERAHRGGYTRDPPAYTAFALEVLRDRLEDRVEKPVPDELGEEVLYCFDRDATVETGIPRGPVPLSTVEELAEDNPVYATGNQRLREEAEIPGVRDIHDGHLGRREGIGLVWQEECDGIDAAVAVDDVDVSDVADLDVYYEPWEFYLLTTGE